MAPNYFRMPMVVGKWYFCFPDSWNPCGSFDTKEEAEAAAREFFSRGTTGEIATAWIGRWVNTPVCGDVEHKVRCELSQEESK